METMNPSVEVQMLNALEFSHYSFRFQNSLFILALEEDVILENVITDLRVLHAAHIRTIIICRDHDKLKTILGVWNARGFPFEYFPKDATEKLTEEYTRSLESVCASGKVPVLGLNPHNRNGYSSDLDNFTMNLASYLSVEKVFFLSKLEGLIIDQKFMSHVTPQEVSQYLEKAKDVNIGMERLGFFLKQNVELGIEIVLLEGKSGCLFQEIFTHRGIGTLLTSDYPNVIRSGELSDVMDISLLMKPYSQSGAILPVHEDEIAAEVDAYYVYSVNNSIVAMAKLTDYGSAVELAKFCTLPRYQGKGRARELAEKMIQSVKEAGKDYIFALSIEPKMFEFFKSLRFQECDRQTLPLDWRRNYNMNRPSIAFKLKVNVENTD